jgi:hypothetical protein
MNLIYYTYNKLDRYSKFYVIKEFTDLEPKKPNAITPFKIGDVVSVVKYSNLCTAHNRTVSKVILY